MLYAVIDIGSTTIRMAIYEILDNKLNLIHKRKYTVGLASYVKDMSWNKLVLIKLARF